MNEDFVSIRSGLFFRFQGAGREVFKKGWKATRPGIVNAFTPDDRFEEDERPSSKKMLRDEMLAATEHLEALARSKDAEDDVYGVRFEYATEYDETATIEDFLL